MVGAVADIVGLYLKHSILQLYIIIGEKMENSIKVWIIKDLLTKGIAKGMGRLSRHGNGLIRLPINGLLCGQDLLLGRDCFKTQQAAIKAAKRILGES
jgi:hypothetical protein